MRSVARRVVWLSVFAVSMGFLEAAVVVYLRELYYPGGFEFPIVLLSDRVATVEIVREATTLFMILAVAALSGTSPHDRFYVFGYLFGVWDLTYYLGLTLFLGWPSSLMTWDILFLIPLPWLSPVLYPVLVSLFLIGGFVVDEGLRSRGGLTLTRPEWIVAATGAVVIVVSFCREWRVVVEQRVPEHFPWWLFALGMLIAVGPFLRAWRRALQR